MQLRLGTAVRFLKGVGPRRAEAFARIGVSTVEDLLYHIPHRYLDATSVTPITKVSVGSDVTVVGRVVSTAVFPTRKRLRIFRAVLKDSSGVIECAWPGQAFLDRVIKKGQLVLVSGPVKFYHGRQIVPREQVILAEEGDEVDGEEMDKGVILAVYPATEGLSHRQIRKLVSDYLDEMVECVEEAIPAEAIRSAGVILLNDAFRALHRPSSVDSVEEGRRRLAYDELFDLQLVVIRARQLAKSAPKGACFTIKKELTSDLKDSLPFELTSDQKQAIREIAADMTSDERMHRLLMGEVGSGKTVVALFAMLLAVENDYQAVFMAPTELLTEQHGRTVSSLLARLGIVPELLLGKLSATEKAAIRQRILDGAAQIVVGTHALLQETTEFRRLGLVVIDEQHRFGVEQRAALIEKGQAPDVLLLTATPIPRTLALTLYGELDISTLREKPVGRTPVKTTVKSETDRGKIYEFLREQCKEGSQAYVVYPVIDESERVDLRAATTMAGELQRELAPLSVGLIHGRMTPDERDAVMRRFRDGELQVLVSTTVIEVGIDVANATVMVIEHPERFGLAQLHQLRGRVGRGKEKSYCILIADRRGSWERLMRFSSISDGFRIAELDLKGRGMGELAGSRQSGGPSLRYTDLSKDGDLVTAARSFAMQVLEKDPTLSRQEHKGLRDRIEQRYERGIELFRVG